MYNNDYSLQRVTCGLSTLGSTLSTLLGPCVLHLADLLVQLWLTARRGGKQTLSWDPLTY